MSIDYYMAIDPGLATGIAIGRITETEPLDVIYTAIVPNGTRGFIDWLEMTGNGKYIVDADCKFQFPDSFMELEYHLDVICETFSLRGGGNFSPNLEPMRIEGVVMDRFGSVVHWQNPSDKSMIGDPFLKRNDLWRTGKHMGHRDGRDANDALLHLFARMMRMKHLPTLGAYFSF